MILSLFHIFQLRSSKYLWFLSRPEVCIHNDFGKVSPAAAGADFYFPTTKIVVPQIIRMNPCNRACKCATATTAAPAISLACRMSLSLPAKKREDNPSCPAELPVDQEVCLAAPTCPKTVCPPEAISLESPGKSKRVPPSCSQLMTGSRSSLVR